MTKNDTKKQSVTDRPTDRRTDRPTDRAGCRVACTRLKKNLSLANCCELFKNLVNFRNNSWFFVILGWLPFSKRVTYFSLVHAYKVRNGLSPAYLSDGFTFISDVHSHNLRHSNVNFSLARCQSPTGTFGRTVLTDWNSLPKQLKESGTLPIFKSHLKLHLRNMWI